LFYPFINEVLASKFGAYVIQPEHRFYGESQVVDKTKLTDEQFMTSLKTLMNPDQALADAINLVKNLQKEMKCTERGTSGYCPVVVVGGSYPGFLSFGARLRYPEVIDISYAASAPIQFYAQKVDTNAYYNLIADSAERSLAGCRENVRLALQEVRDIMIMPDPESFEMEIFKTNNLKCSWKDSVCMQLKICLNTLPEYIKDDFILEEEIMVR